MKKIILLLFVLMIGLTEMTEAKSKWISLFNGKDLNGWFVRGKATWTVQDGVLVGEGGMGHIYSDATSNKPRCSPSRHGLYSGIITILSILSKNV